MTKDTGGPAFPAQFYDERATGMTLRDYFAAKAMQQTMVEFDDAWSHHAYETEEFLQWAAERSYAMADAMLKVRDK